MAYKDRSRPKGARKTSNVVVPRSPECRCIDTGHAHHRGEPCAASAGDSGYCEPCDVERRKPTQDYIKPDPASH